MKLTPDYLNRNQIQTLEKKIRLLKSSLKREEEDANHRLTDLACIIWLSFPKPHNGNLYVYTCSQHHLLCQECLSKVSKCPICKQNFNLSSAKRHLLAERLIAQLQDEPGLKKETDEDLAFETGLLFSIFCITKHLNVWAIG